MRKVRAVVASNIGPKVLLGLTLYFIRNITRAFFTTYCGVRKTNTGKPLLILTSRLEKK